ncbi:LysR family transcriptional regulator [Clostridium chromiireducens]|uniref:LysR family transcriptional regulator n=1 Tax=Clostridium chromiireducens TaxID=225345 RepID=A0A399IU37_9CLOT|nr:LysR family transcriptional regulator [Clostridium chromiireducens]RII36618.1 LysR family transcriptional regulator [Clostridium chromiireducens]
MSMSSYQIFMTVVEQSNFQRAAEILHLTPSAISHSVSGLEKELGFPLFIRNKTGVQLTGYGESILPHIQKVLNSEEHLKQEISLLNGLEKGTIKLGTFNSVCTNWIPNIVKSFYKLYPNISIELYQGNYNDVAEWIKNGLVDIGFLSTSSAGNLEITPMYKDPLVCVVPKKFTPNNRDYITIDDIRGQNFVYQREGCDADINNFFHKYELNAISTCHVVDDQSTIAMVESGFGICIMPELVMLNQNNHVDIYRIEPLEYRIIGITVLNPRFMAPAVKKMFTHIVNTYKNIDI